MLSNRYKDDIDNSEFVSLSSPEIIMFTKVIDKTCYQTGVYTIKYKTNHQIIIKFYSTRFHCLVIKFIIIIKSTK